ncbi:MAG: DEAD/DEAH box helicase [Angelakisella sp.]
MSNFKELGIIDPILKAVADEGYESPSPIQEQAIPHLLAHRDLLGCAQTGTGKTAAFAIPILQLLNEEGHTPHSPIRALILTPTRELAIQIEESFVSYGKYLPLHCCSIFGGVSQNPQVAALRRGAEIVIATPGRLMDLYGQGLLKLNDVSFFVLDEADRMLDMGFVQDIKRIIKTLPPKRQNLMFSATMPTEVEGLVNSILHDPVKVAVTPVSSPVDTIEQTIYYVDKDNKKLLLIDLIRQLKVESALVFSRTKHGADKIVKDLERAHITAQAIHGNKSQGARQAALTSFKNRTIKVLVATDIAARGIDISELSHVFNYDLPNIPETYVHRIGRTGRAGLGGCAISFCMFDELPYLKDIEKLLGKPIPVVNDHPYPLQIFETKATKAPNPVRGGGRSGYGGGSGGGRSSGGRPRKPQQSRYGARSGTAPAKKRV